MLFLLAMAAYEKVPGAVVVLLLLRGRGVTTGAGPVVPGPIDALRFNNGDVPSVGEGGTRVRDVDRPVAGAGRLDEAEEERRGR